MDDEESDGDDKATEAQAVLWVLLFFAEIRVMLWREKALDFAHRAVELSREVTAHRRRMRDRPTSKPPPPLEEDRRE